MSSDYTKPCFYSRCVAPLKPGFGVILILLLEHSLPATTAKLPDARLPVGVSLFPLQASLFPSFTPLSLKPAIARTNSVEGRYAPGSTAAAARRIVPPRLDGVVVVVLVAAAPSFGSAIGSARLRFAPGLPRLVSLAPTLPPFAAAAGAAVCFFWWKRWSE